MEIRSHQETQSVLHTVYSKYVMIEHDGYTYIVPDECASDVDARTLSAYSVLTVNMDTKAIVKSRFF